jgi:ferredoxin
MRLEVDKARCEGHGLCLNAAPEVLHHDENAEVVIDAKELSGDALEQARKAVRLCPVAALRLVEGP